VDIGALCTSTAPIDQPMQTIEIIAPILLLVLLGVLLARFRFLGPEFLGELNGFIFWIALPASLFRTAAISGDSGPETAGILSALLCGTFLIAILGWLTSVALKLPKACHGTVSQSGFRGNLAYIGLPVLSYALRGTPGGEAHYATAAFAMGCLISIYNVLAIIVLQASRHEGSWRALGPGVRSILTNPLLIACLAGLALNAADFALPRALDDSLEALGGAAVPMSLVCIGGSIAFIRIGKNIAPMVASVLLKIAILPVLVYALGRFLLLDPVSMRIALAFAATPTASAAFVMARQMEGDESVASGAIVLSTIFSAISLFLVLWFTQ